MCRRFSENRRRLADLIFETRSFTERELVERFLVQNQGDIAIDGVQTIHGYLLDLAELGALTYERGVYVAA